MDKAPKNEKVDLSEFTAYTKAEKDNKLTDAEIGVEFKKIAGASDGFDAKQYMAYA